jgi:chromosome segregation ATPase
VEEKNKANILRLEMQDYESNIKIETLEAIKKESHLKLKEFEKKFNQMNNEIEYSSLTINALEVKIKEKDSKITNLSVSLKKIIQNFLSNFLIIIYIPLFISYQKIMMKKVKI